MGKINVFHGILIVLLIAFFGLWAGQFFGNRSTDISGVAPLQTENMKNEVSELVSGLPHADKDPYKLHQFHQLLKNRDYAGAQAIAAEMLAASKMLDWSYYPFNKFGNNSPDLGDDSFEARLDEWVSKDSSDALPYIIRAKYYFEVARRVRGDDFIINVTAEHRKLFDDYIGKAIADIDTAISFNDKIPYLYYQKAHFLSFHSGNSAEVEEAFQQGISKYPTYYPLYESRLDNLAPKWGGRADAMYDFTEKYAGKAPSDSPLKFLYIDLFANLLDAASVLCNGLTANDRTRCFDSTMDRLVRPELKDGLHDAFALYKTHDHYQYNNELKRHLFAMAGIAGNGRHFNAFLQLLSEATGSNTELTPRTPSVNNYLIDEAVAHIWVSERDYTNAQQKYGEAVKDIMASADFPGDSEKAEAISDAYDKISAMYKAMLQYDKVLLYQHAMLTLENRKDESSELICVSQYWLKHYDSAVTECTKVVDSAGDYYAQLYRGRAYMELGKDEAALKDFLAVADSQDLQHRSRSDAVIDAGILFDHRGDYKGALAIYDKYAYAFDKHSQPSDVLAITYNNRCFAYLQLGELQKALDYCNTSLTYGNIPDAYKKLEDIKARLKAHEQGT